MLLPIKNMSYLPIIRFKNRWQTFDLNLHYPYSVNGKIINYTHLGYRGDACYIVDNEYNTYYLPHDYAEIINDALKLHSNIYHECDTDSHRRQIITKLENMNRREYGGNDFELLNSVLAEQSRNSNCIHGRILYDTTCNKAYVYNCDGTILCAIRLCHLEPSSTQRGRRSEVTSTFEEELNINNINNFNRLIDNVRASSNSYEFERGYFRSFVSSRFKTYIHQFNYVPKYIKHFMPGESEDTTLLLGAEIEVGGNNNISSDNDKNSTVKKCIQIMNGSDSDEENLIYSTHDSTVQIEFDTMPCSLEFHKNKMNYREMFEYLDKEGYKGHDCETAGLHIHANRSYLGKSRISQELVISKILYILEKFNNEICVIARRDNDYSEFAGEKQNEDSIVELYGKYKDTAADQVQGILQQFHMLEDGSTTAADASMHIVDVLDKVSGSVGIDYAKGIKIISDAVQASGQVAYDAGMSYEQLAAITAKVSERTREDGSSIGNALKTIITRTTKVGKMPQYADEVDNATLSNASASLHAIGVDVYNPDGSDRGIITVMSELKDKWDDLTDAQQAKIAFDVAATRLKASLCMKKFILE